jgi:hypothetical protein
VSARVKATRHRRVDPSPPPRTAAEWFTEAGEATEAGDGLLHRLAQDKWTQKLREVLEDDEEEEEEEEEGDDEGDEEEGDEGDDTE